MNKILCLIFISFVIFSCSSDSIEFEEQIWGKWYVSENVKSYINDTLEVDNTTSFRCEFSSNKLVYFEYNFSKDTAEWIYIKSENSVLLILDYGNNINAEMRFKISKSENNYYKWLSERTFLNQGVNRKYLIDWTLVR